MQSNKDVFKARIAKFLTTVLTDLNMKEQFLASCQLSLARIEALPQPLAPDQEATLAKEKKEMAALNETIGNYKKCIASLDNILNDIPITQSEFEFVIRLADQATQYYLKQYPHVEGKEKKESKLTQSVFAQSPEEKDRMKILNYLSDIKSLINQDSLEINGETLAKEELEKNCFNTLIHIFNNESITEQDYQLLKIVIPELSKNSFVKNYNQIENRKEASEKPGL